MNVTYSERSMKSFRYLIVVVVAAVLAADAFAECVVSEEKKQLDPVEVGFCESDAVFVGKVDGRLETIRAYRPEGSDKTSHFKVEYSNVAVGDIYKGAVPATVKMIANLYMPESAYSFQITKSYLIFAKKLPDENEYSGASAACSVQPTLPLADAGKALKQLEQHRKGVKKIDCENIRTQDSLKAKAKK